MCLFARLWYWFPAAGSSAIAYLLAFTTLLAVVRLVTRTGKKQESVCALVVAALLALFLLMSSALYYRMQEMRAALPLYCVLAGIGFGWMASGFWSLVRRTAFAVSLKVPLPV
jgi:hypothetical protein